MFTGIPELSFMMTARYKGWDTTASGRRHNFVLMCGHTVRLCRMREPTSLIFCTICAESWAFQAAQNETHADRLDITDAGFKALEGADERLGTYHPEQHVTEDTCHTSTRGFPTNP